MALKIGFVFDDSLDRPDGVQQYVLTTGAWLRRRGHNVHYLVSTTERNDIPNIHNLAHNIGVRFNGNRMRMPLPASTYHIKMLLRQEKFDVLHVQMPYSPFLAGRVIRRADEATAVVGTFHIVPQSQYVVTASKLLARWEDQTLRRFDTVLSVSPPAQVFAREAFGLTSGILPNAIALRKFKGAQPFSSSDNRLHILFLGRLVPRKGAMVLLQAVAKLVHEQDLPPFKLTICGRGPLESELKQFVEVHDLQSVVHFAGFVGEIEKPRHLASADITVFPSSGGESFGIVVVEAMASGKSAVLAGDNPGYHALLDHSPGEVLFNPSNSDELAMRLATMLSNKALRLHVAAWQARQAASYDIEKIGPKLELVYQAALQRRSNMR